jgi:hypothetical protein
MKLGYFKEMSNYILKNPPINKYSKITPKMAIIGLLIINRNKCAKNPMNFQ